MDYLDLYPEEPQLVWDFKQGVFVRADQFVATEADKSKALKQAFDNVFKNLKIDLALCRRIMNYTSAVFTRSGNIEWFGSNLLGVDLIKFLSSDKERFFDEVVQSDEYYIESEIGRSGVINQEWNVGGDTFNLTVVYIIHRLIPEFKNKTFYDAAESLVTLMQFVFYTSIYWNFFQNKPVDLPAAEAAYSQLSLKFDIRRMGNWGLHLKDRSEHFLSPNYSNFEHIRKFDIPAYVVRWITDLNTRSRQTVKDYYNVLDQVRRSNSRTITQSSKIELNGETIVRDKVSAFNNAKENLFEASMSYSSFYRDSLFRVVLAYVPKASPEALRKLIRYIPELPLGKKREAVDSIMEDTLAHAFDYVATNRFDFKDVGSFLERMKSLYQAPKSQNEIVLSLRTRVEALAKKETHLKREVDLAAVRTALLLYFLIRSVDI